MSVALLVGGRSSEYDASLHSYANIRRSLIEEVGAPGLVEAVWFLKGDGTVVSHTFANYSDMPIGEEALSRGRAIPLADWTSIVARENTFLYSLLHGHEGEDGGIQGLADIFDLNGNFDPVATSALSMHKQFFQDCIQSGGFGVGVPESLPVRKDTPKAAVRSFLSKLGDSEVVVKPNSLGASQMTELFGAGDYDEITNLIERIFLYDRTALIQKRVLGREFTCGVWMCDGRIEVLPVLEATTRESFMSFENKHRRGRVQVTEYPLAGRDIRSLEGRIAEASRRMFAYFDFRYVCRFDFIAEANGEIVFLEANSLPGFMRESAFTKMLSLIGTPLWHVIDQAVRGTVDRPHVRKRLRYEIDS